MKMKGDQYYNSRQCARHTIHSQHRVHDRCRIAMVLVYVCSKWCKVEGMTHRFCSMLLPHHSICSNCSVHSRRDADGVSTRDAYTLAWWNCTSHQRRKHVCTIFCLVVLSAWDAACALQCRYFQRFVPYFYMFDCYTHYTHCTHTDTDKR